jgi:hypothetical protein
MEPHPLAMTRELTALFVLLVFVQILDYSLELPFDLMVYFDNRVSSQTKLDDCTWNKGMH